MVVTLLMVVAGLVILLGGGAITVRGAVSLARCLGVSPLMIGMTIIAFGTSAPELMVSIQAVLSRHPDIVLGNVVGSNVANILLIVGVAASIKKLFPPGGAALRRDYLLLLIFTVIFVGSNPFSIKNLATFEARAPANSHVESQFLETFFWE